MSNEQIKPVPTAEEMQNWFPDPSPEKRRFRVEVNVQTGERKEIDLTLDEYRQRHVNKIIHGNARVLRKREETKQVARKALMDRLVDRLEVDPDLIDRLARGI